MLFLLLSFLYILVSSSSSSPPSSSSSFFFSIFLSLPLGGGDSGGHLHVYVLHVGKGSKNHLLLRVLDSSNLELKNGDT